MRKVAAENAKLFTEKSIAEAAAIYADNPTRHSHKYKDPRGFAEFAACSLSIPRLVTR